MARLAVLLLLGVLRIVAGDYIAYASPNCGGAGEIGFEGLNNCQGFWAAKLSVEVTDESTGKLSDAASLVVFQDGACGGSYAKVLESGKCYDTSKYQSGRIELLD